MDILVGTLCYVLPTFPLAYFWHLKFFKARYEQWVYFGAPSPPLGLLSMVVQGVVLSWMYFHSGFSPQTLGESFLFVGVIGLFHWSTHVIAAMAKQAESRNMGYFLLETVFLAIQFGTFGVTIWLASQNILAQG